MAEKWTCKGSVRGECGIIHRTEEAAKACIERDHRGCKKHGGYSDRNPVRLDHGDGECVECGAPLVYIEELDELVCSRNPHAMGHGTAESVALDAERLYQ